MKHALSALLIPLIILAGCAAEQEQSSAYNMQFATETRSEQPAREVALPISQPVPAAPSPAAEPKGKQREVSEAARENSLRSERRAYAQGLEKILVSHGVNASVLAYEGQADPTPTLMFVGHFSREFVQRAVTAGAVLQRAKDLGFKSVEFLDRGPDSHYQFALSKTAPLPKCAAHNRLCL
jgi:hypothetical protein